MKTKDIEAMRQFRLMITEVVVPLAVAGMALETTNPGCVKKTFSRMGSSIKNGTSKVTAKFKKDSKEVEAHA